jgi:threonine synthase
MVMAVAKAIEEGSRAVICASTGNTSASAAAYAARTGLRAMVVIPEGKIALGKLSQALIHGAKVVAVDGNFDQALDMVRHITEKHDVTLVNSINPFRIEGQTTAAYEVCDDLGDAPDYLALPVGNAGNITAYWEGFKRYHARKQTTQCPTLLGFQAEGAAPIVRNEVVAAPQTIATAIRIGNPASWQKAVAARDESGGLIDSVTDAEIIEAYRMVADREGIFCEPASAASVAGLRKVVSQGRVDTSKRFVCVLTGHGLKDPDRAVKEVEQGLVGVPPDLSAVERALDLD